MVDEMFGAAHARIEVFRVEIAIIDGVTSRGEPLDDQAHAKRIEACFHRMGIENEDVHGDALGELNFVV